MKYLLNLVALSVIVQARCIMYLTGQHNVVPSSHLLSDVSHVILAFMHSSAFNEAEPSEWPLFTSVSEVRSQFARETSVMIAIGGWGDTNGFSKAASDDKKRKLFAKNVRAMIDHTGADGVDLDWEYPGGNGADYKQVPNEDKAWEMEAYPKLLAEIRAAIGPDRIMSAAVPGLPRDMIAFTSDTIPEIEKSLDFFNIMTYDLMNRRDNVTKHHTSIEASLTAIDHYLSEGVPATKANLGFGFYVKYFRTDPNGGCKENPVGCKTTLMEDPETGADLGQTGGFSWHDDVPSEVAESFTKALKNGEYDEIQGGYYFWDAEENIWWTWDTPEAIEKKVSHVMTRRGLGGVFAWGLGEDAPEWDHLKALTRAYDGYKMVRKDGSVLEVLKDEL